MLILPDPTHAGKAHGGTWVRRGFSSGFEALGSASIEIIEMSQSDQRHFRAFGRKEQRLEARISRGDTEGPRPAAVLNLGLGGACLELDGPLDEPASVTVAIDLPGLWNPLELAAEVAWSRAVDDSGKCIAGVRFLGASGRALRLLSEALAPEWR